MNTKKKIVARLIFEETIPAGLPEVAVDLMKSLLRVQIDALTATTPGWTAEVEIVDESPEPTKHDEATAARLLQSVRSEFAASDAGKADSQPTEKGLVDELKSLFLQQVRDELRKQNGDEGNA